MTRTQWRCAGFGLWGVAAVLLGVTYTGYLQAQQDVQELNRFADLGLTERHEAGLSPVGWVMIALAAGAVFGGFACFTRAVDAYDPAPPRDVLGSVGEPLLPPGDPTKPWSARQSAVLKELFERVKAISIKRLITDFPQYGVDVGRFAKHPFRFMDGVDYAKRDDFWKAVDFLTYGIAVAFLLMVPAFLMGQEKVSRTIFFLRVLIQFALYGLFLNLMLGMFAGRKTDARRTLIAYASMGGVSLPLFILAAYPLILRFGTGAILGSPEFNEQAPELFRDRPGLMLYTIATMGLQSWLLLAIATSWLSRAHGMSIPRVLGAVVLLGFLMMFVQKIMLNPFLNHVSAWYQRFLDAFK